MVAVIDYVKVGTICGVKLLLIFKSLGFREPQDVGEHMLWGDCLCPVFLKGKKERILE